MSFDLNFSGGSNKPIIKESQAAQDGGAGNLGYFEQQRKEEEERKQREKDKSIFGGPQEDSFEKHDGKNEDESLDDFSISKIIAQIILTVKEWFKNLLK